MTEQPMKTIREVKVEGDRATVTETKVPQKLVYKIKYGYGAHEFILTESLDEVAKAMYAKAERIGVTLSGRFISGAEIKTIEPDIHSYTGWHRSYEPQDGDDFKQIERDVPKMLYELLDATSKRVSTLLTSGQVQLIGSEGLTPTLLLGDNTMRHG